MTTRSLAPALALALAIASNAPAQQPPGGSTNHHRPTAADAWAPALSVPVLALLPRPDSVELREGTFALRSPVRIVVATPSARLREIAGLLRDWLAESGLRATVAQRAAGRGDVTLALARAAGDGAEGYTLEVDARGVRIAAPAAAGVLWAVQTLRQMLASDIGHQTSDVGRQTSGSAPAAPVRSPDVRRPMSVVGPPGAPAPPATITLPALVIHDAPRFSWRGSLMDVGRHFFPVPFVERYVDLLSRYKLNVLHWHLTEDQGWRLEIRRYPRLTEVGAWRTEQDGTRYGGFYTQAEVRRVVEYARLRGVAVVPEIEMPGHSLAAIAAYPWLGCTGDPLEVPNTWGVFQDVYCPREGTFTFLEHVLTEVLALFPSQYVHIGGDEVPKDRWKACTDCQELMRREGLANEEELQSWFVRRIGRWLAAHGRRLVGWDEITEGGLAPGAVVQVWREAATIATVARAGHDLIASPASHTYINRSPAELGLADVYDFEPVPDGLTPQDAARVLGAEATLWSEGITTANFDLMAFPRLLAFAEVLWTTGPRDLPEFRARLAAGEAPRLRALGVALGPEDHDLLTIAPTYDSTTGRLGWRTARGVDGLELRYTTDGTAPTAASPPFDDSLGFAGPGAVRLQPFFRGEPMLGARTLTIGTHLARGRPITLTTPADPRYPGTGPRTLTDGALGSTDFHDGLWQGWDGPDLEAVIDLGAPVSLRAVEGSFQQTMRSWILLPRDFTVWLSDDGATWREVGTATHQQPAERADPFLWRLSVPVAAGTAARWVKVRARGYGPLPAWHSGAGNPGWVFCDEIVVR